MAAKNTRKVLVVDDDPATRFLCSEFLAIAGYEVETAPDGLSALNLLKTTAYSLVLTDINMPGLNGIDLYASATESHSYLKDLFLFMSSELNVNAWSRIRELGKKCLVKPFKISELIGHVDKIMLRPVERSHRQHLGNRREMRFSLSGGCEVFEKGAGKHEALEAAIQDISAAGLRIRYAGRPIAAGTERCVYANINGMDLLMNATVVWSKEAGDNESASGLGLSRPIPVSSIVDIEPYGGRVKAAV